MSEFSFYSGGIKNKTPTKSITLEEVITLIRSGSYAEPVSNIRLVAGQPKAVAFHKKELDYVTFSGIFSPTRLAANLVTHSGLIVIDFDHLQDANALKLQLQSDSYVTACFISPSGEGLKAVVKIKDTDRHKDVFTDLAFYFNNVYRLEDKEKVDPSGSDVSRACFMSFDPDAYYNPDSKVYIIQNQIPEKPRTERQLEKAASDQEKYIACLVDRIEANTMDICNDYGQEWLLIAFSLSVLGEAGRSYFHRVSKQNAKYDKKDTDEKFDNAIKTCRFTNPAKFINICKDYGIDVSYPKSEKPAKDSKKEVDQPAASKSKKRKKEDEEGWHDTVWYEEGGMKIKAGKYFDEVAPNFQLFIKYRTEDEQENVTWVLEIRKDDRKNIYIEVLHDDFCSARKLKNMLATKRLGFKIKDGHLDELHSYLFTKTEFSTAIKVVRYGFHPDSSVYFFANKALNLKTGKMLTPDQFGIVQANEMHLSVPQQSKQRQNRYWLTDQDVSFQQFWNLYATAHGHENAFIPACFYIFSLFRDIGLHFKNFSPILYLKGGAGTGKSSMIRIITAAFGRKQEGVNLKSKNTDAALVKLMSQTSNAIVWFDEFHNELPNEGLLQAAYDNDGYHKSTTDFNSIDTATVEIHSALGLTSNYIPANNIFFSRCLFVPITESDKSDRQRAAFDELKELEEGGLASMTVELLKYRDLLVANDNYNVCYNRLYNGFRERCKGQKVGERLFANMAQVMAAALAFNSWGKINLLTFQTTNEDEILSEFIDIGEKFIMRQFRITNDSKAVAEFFEIIQGLFDSHQISEELHFRFQGDNILINFRKLYNLFAQKYRTTFFKTPPDRDTIQSELATVAGKNDWESIVKPIRFANDGTSNSKSSTIPQNGSCELNYKQLQLSFGIDFMNRTGGMQ